jgi:hypothetical protein
VSAPKDIAELPETDPLDTEQTPDDLPLQEELDDEDDEDEEEDDDTEEE